MYIGANIHTIPGDSHPNQADAIKSLTYELTRFPNRGLARVSAIFWEIWWDPNAPADYSGLNKTLDMLKAKGIRPLIILSPTPYPTSLWYSDTPHDDWWLPRKDVWANLAEKTNELIAHCDSYMGPSLLPYYQLLNEPATGKPGASIHSTNGEWYIGTHEFMFFLCNNVKLPIQRMVSPAISCIDEAVEAGELRTCNPPDAYNWLPWHSITDFHLRFSVSWAWDINQFAVEIKDRTNEMLAKMQSVSHTKRMFVSEVYVSNADVGYIPPNQTYADTVARSLADDPFRRVVIKELQRMPIEQAMVWGLSDTERDSDDPWFIYGGWGYTCELIGVNNVNPPQITVVTVGSKPPQVIHPPVAINPVFVAGKSPTLTPPPGAVFLTGMTVVNPSNAGMTPITNVNPPDANAGMIPITKNTENS